MNTLWKIQIGLITFLSVTLWRTFIASLCWKKPDKCQPGGGHNLSSGPKLPRSSTGWEFSGGRTFSLQRMGIGWRTTLHWPCLISAGEGQFRGGDKNVGDLRICGELYRNEKPACKMNKSGAAECWQSSWWVDPPSHHDAIYPSCNNQTSYWCISFLLNSQLVYTLFLLYGLKNTLSNIPLKETHVLSPFTNTGAGSFYIQWFSVNRADE